jgi:hypothetical protein
VEATVDGLPERFLQASSVALVQEAEAAVDGGVLVVSPEEEEGVGILDLIGEEEADGLDATAAAVHVVPQEEVAVGVGRVTTRGTWISGTFLQALF